MNIQPISAFTDNYIWMFTDAENQRACVVDPGDAAPVFQTLGEQRLELAAIMLTHHHPDHTGGVTALTARYPAVKVYGPDSARIPTVTTVVDDNASVEVFGRRFSVISVPGHTLDHIAFYSESSGADDCGILFCGDTLFAAGCGRLFEGDAHMMYESLQKLAALPESTLVYCAHEYTLANLRFARAVEPESQSVLQRIHDNSKRIHDGEPTLPSTIELELRTNPFLRCQNSVVRASAAAHMKTAGTNAVEIFAALRQWKDNYKA